MSVSVATQSAKGLKRQTETGDFLALPNGPPGNGHQITDWDKFRENALTNGDKTQVKIALLWDGEISSRTISRALRKIGFTQKKRPMAFQERDEAKRQVFVAKLSTIASEQIVYLDESGMDNLHQYDYAWNSLWSTVPCTEVRDPQGSRQ